MLTLLGLGVLQNIGQSFLHQPVQHRRHIRGQRIISPERLNIDTNAITLLPFRNIGFDRPENSEVIDRRRPQVRCGAMNVTADLCRELFQPSYLLGCRRCVRPLANPCSSAFRPRDNPVTVWPI